MSSQPLGYKKLNNGQQMPMIGFGTWNCPVADMNAIMRNAIAAGYRHFDCAHAYANEKAIGNVLKDLFKEGVVKREDLFITSKLWPTGSLPKDVKEQCQITCSRLGIDYLDLYLMHWPFSYEPRTGEKIDELFPRNENGDIIFTDTSYVDTWKAMESLVSEGLTRAIGVANFNSVQIQDLVSKATIKPATNQIEVHPYNSNYKLVALCETLSVPVTAYSPFASPQRPWGQNEDPVIFNEAKLQELAVRKKKTKAQLILRWLYQRNIMTIPKTVNADRMRENFQISDFQLAPEEMAVIDAINQDLKLLIPLEEKNGKMVYKDGGAPDFPFNIPY